MTTFEPLMARVQAGERLPAHTIRELATTPDILPLGMLADAVHRRLHGGRVTYVRVAICPFDRSFADAVPIGAREIRVTGAPETLEVALTAVTAAKAVAGERPVSAFSWADVERLGGTDLPAALRDLRAAGLESVGDLPLDRIGDHDRAIDMLMTTGFTHVRLTIEKAPAADRADLLLRAAELQDRFGSIHVINPLPLSLNTFRPTTGYDDVKMVAVARLAAPNISSVQVDWLRYGPKLAQVALTFGADDIYGVSPSDQAPEGRRRAPVEEIRRNIEAAGFQAIERDGRFAALG